jgi:hypothetical protein
MLKPSRLTGLKSSGEWSKFEVSNEAGIGAFGNGKGVKPLIHYKETSSSGYKRIEALGGLP